MSNKKGMSTGAMIGVGAGVAALSAAAYLLFGPDGKKNRKVIRSWAVKMKGDIIEKFEEAKEITEPIYHKIIEEVQAKYSQLPNVDKKELEMVVSEVKKHWKTMMKDAKPKSKKPKIKAKSKKKSKSRK
jgi:gas vesicle protein